MNPMILFPSRPDQPWKIDPDFEAEVEAARNEDLAVYPVDHTAIIQGRDPLAAVDRVRSRGLAFYRGWMLRPEQYRAMYGALVVREVQLINTPEQYQTCHYLPDSYPYIKDHTPRTTWFRSIEQLELGLGLFGDGPVIVKDYVKSQKHYWREACYIPRASDLPAARKVVERFLELQGDDLNEGLVLRQYTPLKIIGQHPKSQMPLGEEYRIYWLDGRPIVDSQYWGGVAPFKTPLPWDELRPIAQRIPSRFFTTDIAFVETGLWVILELGDGQVSGLPSPDLASVLYRQIKYLRPQQESAV